MTRRRLYTLSSAHEGSVRLRPAPPAESACRFLVSLDYDGTLKPEGGEVEEAFWPLVLRLRPLGLRWGINTGRSLLKLAAELASLPVAPDFVCTCERYVYLADAAGRLRPAMRHNARCLRTNLRLRSAVLEAWQTALAPHAGPAWQFAADDPLSVEAVSSAALDALVPYMEHLAVGSVAMQRAGRFVRLSDARFTKGSALRYVQRRLRVRDACVCLMGDGHNDLDAFREFPQAFCAAPAAAHPDVISWLQTNGGYISPTDGVVQALHIWAQHMGIAAALE